MTFIQHIPSELMFEIFCQSGFPCVLTSRSACKLWNEISRMDGIWKFLFVHKFGKVFKPGKLLLSWEDTFQKYETNTKGLQPRELLNWSIKHKCLALFRHTLHKSPLTPLWSAERDKTSSLVYIAAVRGLPEFVSLLLSHAHCHPDETLPGDSTPLYVAAQECHYDTVKLLIDKGANLEFSFREGFTPIYVACQRGNLEIVRLLVHSGANINAACVNGSTPLYIASQEGKSEVVGYLLDNGSLIEATFRRGFTSLYVAARNGHVTTVQKLIQYGARLNAKDDDGSTPVYVASQNGHAAVVKTLLAAGAHPEIEFLGGYSPLYVASQNGHHEVVAALCAHPLTDIDKKAPNGSPPLYIACQNGCYLVVAELLKHGASIACSLSSGYSPLYIATHKGYFDIVNLLVQQKELDIDFHNQSQPPALYAACYVGRLDIVTLLVENGADVFLVYEQGSGKNIMHVAVEMNDIDLVMYFLRLCPQLIFDPDSDGIVPLEEAFNLFSPLLFRILLRELRDNLFFLDDIDAVCQTFDPEYARDANPPRLPQCCHAANPSAENPSQPTANRARPHPVRRLTPLQMPLLALRQARARMPHSRDC